MAGAIFYVGPITWSISPYFYLYIIMPFLSSIENQSLSCHISINTCHCFTRSREAEKGQKIVLSPESFYSLLKRKRRSFALSKISTSVSGGKKATSIPIQTKSNRIKERAFFLSFCLTTKINGKDEFPFSRPFHVTFLDYLIYSWKNVQGNENRVVSWEHGCYFFFS